jgi:hypothetical protein
LQFLEELFFVVWVRQVLRKRKWRRKRRLLRGGGWMRRGWCDHSVLDVYD